MAQPTNPASAFSIRFAEALRAVMERHSVTQAQVAAALGRNQSFVSERTSGKRPTDTDILAGVAAIAGLEPRDLTKLVLAEMGRPEAQVHDLQERRNGPQAEAALDPIASLDQAPGAEEDW